MEEGKETVLEIRVEGNPFPNVSWQHNSKMVELDPERLQLRADRFVLEYGMLIILTKTHVPVQYIC
jgi:hypothetical protein